MFCIVQNKRSFELFVSFDRYCVLVFVVILTCVPVLLILLNYVPVLLFLLI